MSNKRKEQVKLDISIIAEAPNLIRMARRAIELLPPGKRKQELINCILNARRELIKLDVLLQDLEWGFSEKMLKRAEKTDDLSKTDNFFYD